MQSGIKVTFTRHAKNRMRWRSIKTEEVLACVWVPDKHEKLESNKYHYFKTVGKKYLRVTLVFEPGQIVVISVVDKKD